MSATMSEIAQEVGVSVTVVSRFVREDPTLRISEHRRREIRGVIERLGGVKVRKYCRKPQTLTRVVMVPMNRRFSQRVSSTDRHFTESDEFRQIEQSLKAEGFSLHVTFFTSEEERQVMESLICSQNQCDALLLLSGIANKGLAELIREAKFPHACDSPQGETYRLNCVRVDAADGIRQAVEHLYGLGHRRIGFLGNRSLYRYPLLVAALAAQGLPIDEQQNCWVDADEVESESHLHQLGYEACRQWLRNHPKATAPDLPQ